MDGLPDGLREHFQSHSELHRPLGRVKTREACPLDRKVGRYLWYLLISNQLRMQSSRHRYLH